jgi:Tfp pilus assembly protein PilN
MRAVNLLPPEEQPQSFGGRPVPAIVGAALGVVVTGSLAVTFLGAAGNVRTARAQLANVEQQLAATPAPPAPKVPANAQLAGEQNARLTALSTALGGRVAWDRVLRDFSLVLPNDVWLSTLTMTAPDPAAVASGASNFTMSGYTYSHDSVARLLSRLALLPELTNVSLATSTEAKLKNGPTTVQFSINATVPAPTGTAAPSTPAAATTPAPDTTTTDTTSTDTTASGS